MQTLDRYRWLVDPETVSTDGPADDPSPAGGSMATRGRRSGARDAFVAITVCLGLWAVLAAPTLERIAEASPIGARRTAALAVLRPLVDVSRMLMLLRATGSVERAVDRDPREQPGGDLVLPEVDLPPAPPQRVDVADPSPPPEGVTERHTSEEATASEGAAGEEAAADQAPIRSPTPSRPLRVAVIGDSLSQGLGPAVERWIDPDLARVLSLGRQSTGLARQDYFDWLAGMRQIVDRFRPDLVFVMLGSNDDQPQVAPDGSAIPLGSTRWVENYRTRAERLVRIATRSGTRVVWVGIPVVRERERWTFYRRVNGIYRDVTTTDPLATYVDAWSAFEARDGGYAPFVRNDHGELLEVRASDGVHFTPTGYTFLGRLAISAAAEPFGLRQEAITFRL